MAKARDQSCRVFYTFLSRTLFTADFLKLLHRSVRCVVLASFIVVIHCFISRENTFHVVFMLKVWRTKVMGLDVKPLRHTLVVMFVNTFLRLFLLRRTVVTFNCCRFKVL